MRFFLWVVGGILCFRVVFLHFDVEVVPSFGAGVVISMVVCGVEVSPLLVLDGGSKLNAMIEKHCAYPVSSIVLVNRKCSNKSTSHR